MAYYRLLYEYKPRRMKKLILLSLPLLLIALTLVLYTHTEQYTTGYGSAGIVCQGIDVTIKEAQKGLLDAGETHLCIGILEKKHRPAATNTAI